MNSLQDTGSRGLLFGDDADLITRLMTTLAAAGLGRDFLIQLANGGSLVTKVAELYKSQLPIPKEDGGGKNQGLSTRM